MGYLPAIAAGRVHGRDGRLARLPNNSGRHFAVWLSGSDLDPANRHVTHTADADAAWLGGCKALRHCGNDDSGDCSLLRSTVMTRPSMLQLIHECRNG